MHNGYGFFADHKLVTMFSAPRYYPEVVVKFKKKFFK